MKFVFPNLDEHEANIIANFLAQDNKIFKTYQRKMPIYIDYEDDEPFDYIDIFDIVCNTDLAYYDFAKNITSKKIKAIRDLNEIYYTKEKETKGKKTKGKKNVSTRKKTSD